jgi:excinuclease ABC subunit A
MQTHSHIEIEGARVHNLKNISLAIPKNKLVVITGLSGSGKSSLAFDTIYAEGQRRYLESVSGYARQFMGDLERPDVDSIKGLSPVISIEQKTTNRNPRSTVGTVTEIYDFLRLLYARIADAYSYHTNKKMVQFSESEIVQHVKEHLSNKKIILLAPLVRGRKGHYRELFEQLRKQGYIKVRVDNELLELKEKMQVDRYKVHDIEAVIDQTVVKEPHFTRLSQSIQKGLQVGKDLLFILDIDTQKVHAYSKQLMCIDTGLSYEIPSPNSFSFNSPYGSCPTCKGLGTINQINMEAVIPNWKASIKEGGLAPLGEEREAYAYKQVISLAKKHKISLDTPIEKIPTAKLNILLYGNEEGLRNQDANSAVAIQDSTYEGLINMVYRWFEETNSEPVKDWAEQFMQLDTCATCQGTRLKKESLFFKVDDKNIAELNALSIKDLHTWMLQLHKQLNKKQLLIATDLIKEIIDRLGFLVEVGLHYLTLDRTSKTLSGGESQRIRLATQIGSQLTGITYILDEPSIGLHQRDNEQLIQALKRLRDSNNSVIVVEHDKDIMLAADYLIDIGPGAGIHGGAIISKGKPQEIITLSSSTNAYLSGEKKIIVPTQRRKGNGEFLELKGAKGHTLKNVSIKIPIAAFTCVTGVSGSGKSTLINETLYPLVAAHCYTNYKQKPLAYQSIKGLEHIDKVIEIDQSPIGRTPRSNPATYCGFFNDIRQLFALVPEAKIRGYQAGRFSFNVKGGRCETCEGAGLRHIEMNFLPDVFVPCEHCNGARYNRETLEIRYKGKSIADVLNLTIEEAVSFFNNVPFILRKIKTLHDVGLGYIKLGQSSTTLSGGEAQRIKIATELSKRDTGKTLYILDEPTTGLHFQDIQLLINVLNKLVDRGNTLIVIEHNLDIIKTADYLIDVGPEGGKGGGTIVAQGSPEVVAKNKDSHTARFLQLELL